EFFVRRYSLIRHPIGRGGDATVIATLPNPPAEVIAAYSRKLSSESMRTGNVRAVNCSAFWFVSLVRRRGLVQTRIPSTSSADARNPRKPDCTDSREEKRGRWSHFAVIFRKTNPAYRALRATNS